MNHDDSTINIIILVLLLLLLIVNISSSWLLSQFLFML